MTTITVLRPVRVNTPRATSWAADLFLAVLRAFQGSRKARAEQQAVAQRQADAAAVREYANRYAQHDPRFAADLLAAADRHEAGL